MTEIFPHVGDPGATAGVVCTSTRWKAVWYFDVISHMFFRISDFHPAYFIFGAQL